MTLFSDPDTLLGVLQGNHQGIVSLSHTSAGTSNRAESCSIPRNGRYSDGQCGASAPVQPQKARVSGCWVPAALYRRQAKADGTSSEDKYTRSHGPNVLMQTTSNLLVVRGREISSRNGEGRRRGERHRQATQERGKKDRRNHQGYIDNDEIGE